MELIQTIADMLDRETAQLLYKNAERLSELRLRAGKPVQLRFTGGGECMGRKIEASRLYEIVNRLMENSLYACEKELKQGFFTTREGARVGICGKINAGENCVHSVANIGSVCIRIPRQVRGCASELEEYLLGKGLNSMLILSAPGLGKTTILRELIRCASQAGYNTAVADERREIAACLDGQPTLDIGSRTDVMDGCIKSISIPMLVRACSPDLIAADEIGSSADAEAIMDAKRCGIAVLATAHADSLEAARRRKNLALLLDNHIFRYCAVLGPKPGMIEYVHDCMQGGIEKC